MVWDATAMAATVESEMMRDCLAAGAITDLADAARAGRPPRPRRRAPASAPSQPPPGRRRAAGAVPPGLGDARRPHHPGRCRHRPRRSGARRAAIDPIPDLYAAGGTACGLAGPSSDGYSSGNGLLSAFGMGWIVGNSLAERRTPDVPPPSTRRTDEQPRPTTMRNTRAAGARPRRCRWPVATAPPTGGDTESGADDRDYRLRLGGGAPVARGHRGRSGYPPGRGQRARRRPTGRGQRRPPVRDGRAQAETSPRSGRTATRRTDWDTTTYADCPGPPESGKASPHGINVETDLADARRSTSSTTAVVRPSRCSGPETSPGKPIELTWVGCAEMPTATFPNGVAPLPNARGLRRVELPRPDLRPPVRWHVHRREDRRRAGVDIGRGWRTVPRSALGGANGIEVTEDGAQWSSPLGVSGSSTGSRCGAGNAAVTRTSVAVPLKPDNLRWTADGHLLLTGQDITEEEFVRVRERRPRGCPTGITVLRLDPTTMRKRIVFTSDTTKFRVPTVATPVGPRHLGRQREGRADRPSAKPLTSSEFPGISPHQTPGRHLLDAK